MLSVTWLTPLSMNYGRCHSHCWKVTRLLVRPNNMNEGQTAQFFQRPLSICLLLWSAHFSILIKHPTGEYFTLASALGWGYQGSKVGVFFTVIVLSFWLSWPGGGFIFLFDEDTGDAIGDLDSLCVGFWVPWEFVQLLLFNQGQG